MRMKKWKLLALLFVLCLTLSVCVALLAGPPAQAPQYQQQMPPQEAEVFYVDDIPAYSGEAYIAINDNQPFFSEAELTTEAFEEFSPLDALGRCGVAYANVCQELMPTEERGNISHVKPTGWQSVQYDIVDGKSLYNRCHLLGFQLTGENANELNLITGTRYMNVDGMLPFENMVADYVKETDNHVLYRVTPFYTDSNLVADGVLMEAYSVEDDGEGICFNVYCYNVQPGVEIDYATGESRLSDEIISDVDAEGAQDYVLNTSSRKFHKPDCSGAADIKQENRQDYTGTRETLIDLGYAPCGNCKP